MIGVAVCELYEMACRSPHADGALPADWSLAQAEGRYQTRRLVRRGCRPLDGAPERRGPGGTQPCPGQGHDDRVTARAAADDERLLSGPGAMGVERRQVETEPGLGEFGPRADGR